MGGYYTASGNIDATKSAGGCSGCIIVLAVVVGVGLLAAGFLFNSVAEVGRQERERQERPEVKAAQARMAESKDGLIAIRDKVRSRYREEAAFSRKIEDLGIEDKLRGKYFSQSDYAITKVEGTVVYVVCALSYDKTLSLEFDVTTTDDGSFGATSIE